MSIRTRRRTNKTISTLNQDCYFEYMDGRSHTQPHSHSVQIPVFLLPIPYLYLFLVRHCDSDLHGLNCRISDFRSCIIKSDILSDEYLQLLPVSLIIPQKELSQWTAHTRVIRDNLLLRLYPSLVAINNPPHDRVFLYDAYVKWTPQSFCSVVTLDFNSVDMLTLWKTVTGLQNIPH